MELRTVARQERPVEVQAELTDPVARLDDPRDHALPGRADEVSLRQQVDVVVELGLAHAQDRGQPLDREGLPVITGHDLEDAQAERVGECLDRLDVADPALGERLGSLVGERSAGAFVHAASIIHEVMNGR